MPCATSWVERARIETLGARSTLAPTRALIRGPCVRGTLQTAQEIGAHRVQIVVVIDALEPLERPQPGLGA
jgi:hypothetical protein